MISRKKERLPRVISKICAADAAYRDETVVAVATLFVEGRLSEWSSYSGRCALPYVSGLFYLREGPFVTEAVRRLKSRPQLVCFDAHGTAHPRLAGLATVCGMILGIPSVGIAKSLLVGTPAPVEGSSRRIVYRGRTVGFVVGAGGKRRYWSPGYSVSLRGLESVILRCESECLQAIEESDKIARALVRTQEESFRHQKNA